MGCVGTYGSMHDSCSCGGRGSRTGKKAADHAMEENLISGDAAVNSNPTALSGVRSVNEKSASSEMSPGQTIGIDRTDTVISHGQNSSPATESPVPGQSPVSAPTSETYQPETQADASDVPSAAERHRAGNPAKDSQSKARTAWSLEISRREDAADRTLARKFGSKSSYSRSDNILESQEKRKSKTGYTR